MNNPQNITAEGRFTDGQITDINLMDVFREYVNPTVTLTDAASVSLDASLGTTFYLTATGDRTILAPSNAKSGKVVRIVHKASGGARTLALTTGSAGAFRFGSSVTSIAQTASGKTDYITAIYNATDDRFDVQSQVAGF